jgi:UDP-N-acetylmuramyl pentapeptide synthase
VVNDASGLPEDAPAIVVDDSSRALQRLAAAWRARFGGVVVGITGSNGKTTVKEMLAAIVGQQRRVFRSPGSFNSQIGVALALLRLPLDAEVALIECGVSRPGEMDALRDMVAPDAGMVTNIGTAHLAGFGTPAAIAAEKFKLFSRLAGPLVLHESARPYWSGECAPQARSPG